MTVEEAASYRQRAREMRKQAARAESRALSDSYLAISAEWDRRAKELEHMMTAGSVPYEPAMELRSGNSRR